MVVESWTATTLRSFIYTARDGHILKEGDQKDVLKYGPKQNERVAMDEACSSAGEDDFQARMCPRTRLMGPLSVERSLMCAPALFVLQEVAESLGIGSLPDEIAEKLASDVEYRIHQVVQVRPHSQSLVYCFRMFA